MRGGVLAGWRLLRCNPWSHGGVDYAHDQTSSRSRSPEGAHVIVAGILSPIENVLTDVLTWLHDTGGLTWAWSIVALTVIVRFLLVPVAIRQIHSMQSLQLHAPEMKTIQQHYKTTGRSRAKSS